ncbi:MAG: LacI family DNA-binding transcriptional regulator [Chitinophagaceae bacterium]
MQQSTLKELSGVLGLSISTVSRALKDHPDISVATKKKVKDLAEALEYEPNSYAVNLRTRQSNVLGILVPSIDNFFYDSFIASVEEEARLHDYSVLIMQSRDQLQIETSCLQLFRKKMITGLFASISTEVEDMSAFQKLQELDVPVVFFDRVPEVEGYHKVCMSDERAASIAAETIIRKKKKKVLALFGHPHLSISKMRCSSFQKTFYEQAPDTPLDIYYPEGIEESKRLVMSIMSKKNDYDVIFCMGDLILIGVMHAIHELDLKVPEDIGVIGISNGLIPTMYKPKVTYVETSGAKLGKLAFNRMLSCLKHDDLSTPEDVVFLESVLVEGGSL